MQVVEAPWVRQVGRLTSPERTEIHHVGETHLRKVENELRRVSPHRHRLKPGRSSPETAQVANLAIIGRFRRVWASVHGVEARLRDSSLKAHEGEDWPERPLHGTLLGSSRASTTDASYRERSQDALSEKSQPHQEDPQAGLSCAHEDQCRTEDHQPPATSRPFDQCPLSDSLSTLTILLVDRGDIDNR